MNTKSAENIKKEIADRYNINVEPIRCSNCVHWGFNRGLWMNNMTSRCNVRRENTNVCEWCKSFEPDMRKSCFRNRGE